MGPLLGQRLIDVSGRQDPGSFGLPAGGDSPVVARPVHALVVHAGQLSEGSQQL